MKVFDVEIAGVTPLLQHRFGEHAEVEGGKATRRAVVVQDETPREIAAKLAYKNSKGEFFFPGAAIGRLLREAGGAHKLKGTRKSVKYIIPAAVLMLHDEVVIRNGDGKPAKDFEVDSRPVTIPATKGRVMRHRPRFEKWGATFALRVNEMILPPDVIHKLLTEGGEQIGIGDFRPERGGPFGTFQVTSWKEAKT
jgi:hypothetical protein